MAQLLTRRGFIRAGCRTAAAAATLRALDARAAPALLGSFEPQTRAGRAAALRPAFALIDQFVTRHMAETGAPGLTLSLADAAGLLRASAYGFADLKTRARVTPDTLFEIGSISKSFVAVALLQLRDEGKLDFHRPVTDYVPWLRIDTKFEPVTVHHLVTHTAGLPGAPLLLDALLAPLWTAWKPGSRFLYSNTGYNILGFVIEAADGRPFADAMRARVLAPLGMTASSPTITNETRARMAVGYEPVPDDRPWPARGPLGEAQWIEVDIAAGSVASTPADMASYMSALINRGQLKNGRRLFSEESFKQMIAPAIRAPFRGEEASYGYGLWVSQIEGHTRLRHTGGMVAFSSSMDVDVTGGTAAFASVNANLRGYRPVAVTKFAIGTLNAALSGKTLPTLPAPAPPAEEIKNAAEFAGTYTAPDGRRLMLVAEGQRLLLLHKGRRVVLERAGGPNTFLVRHPDFDLFLLGFVREGDAVTEAFHGADWFAGGRYKGAREFSHSKEWEGYVGHYHNDSPWYGDARVVLRKGRLWLDGLQPLVPKADGTFGAGDAEGPDRVGFESIVQGRAMRMNYSGILFRRAFTP
ncbi:MAG TPA: serine hydrolase [Pyrinomonadaceae bacterium]|nr:serine hydrolase [Pyrinomonadaceae bacterium]